MSGYRRLHWMWSIRLTIQSISSGTLKQTIVGEPAKDYKLNPPPSPLLADFPFISTDQGKTRQDKTRQDNVLFGVLYNPMYIDFIQII